MDKPETLANSKNTSEKFQCRDIPGLQGPRQVLQPVTFVVDRGYVLQLLPESLLVHMVQRI